MKETAVHCVVVDTNVLAVAEGLHDSATEECVLACIRLLRRVEMGQVLGVDTDDAILAEYVGTLNASKNAGLGQKLARLLWRRRFDNAVCHRVAITPVEDPPGSYTEIPVTLSGFDVDDQKFLAVAVAEGRTPPIFQALDEEWWRRREDLTANGLDIQFLCVADLL